MKCLRLFKTFFHFFLKGITEMLIFFIFFLCFWLRKRRVILKIVSFVFWSNQLLLWTRLLNNWLQLFISWLQTRIISIGLLFYFFLRFFVQTNNFGWKLILRIVWLLRKNFSMRKYLRFTFYFLMNSVFILLRTL